MQTLPLRTPDMEAMLRRWGSALQHSGPTLAAVVLTLLIAWLLAELTWSFLPRPKAAETLSVPAPALSVANGDEEPYAIGATVPGGAVIRAIFPDRVMLDRGGQIEALRLPKDDTTGATV